MNSSSQIHSGGSRSPWTCRRSFTSSYTQIFFARLVPLASNLLRVLSTRPNVGPKARRLSQRGETSWPQCCFSQRDCWNLREPVSFATQHPKPKRFSAARVQGLICLFVEHKPKKIAFVTAINNFADEFTNSHIPPLCVNG
jgi:hypothetical protein